MNMRLTVMDGGRWCQDRSRRWRPAHHTMGIVLYLLQLSSCATAGPASVVLNHPTVQLDTGWPSKPKRMAPQNHYSDYWRFIGYVAPSFDNSSSRNVTTQLGQTIYLHCIVNNLGDKTVSWIRRRDFHILTVGVETYTTDDRFQSIHVDGSNKWSLQIKYPQMKDSGVYECQVSSDPKISFFVRLNVVVAKAEILGPSPLYVKAGSSINLTCVISQCPEPPVFVFWYHNDRMINYDASRGDISIQKASGDTAISTFYIRDIQTPDSGNYTCCPSNADAVSVTVYVLNDEKPMPMQHDAKSPHAASASSEGRSDVLSSYSRFVFFLSFLLATHLFLHR